MFIYTDYDVLAPVIVTPFFSFELFFSLTAQVSCTYKLNATSNKRTINHYWFRVSHDHSTLLFTLLLTKIISSSTRILDLTVFFFGWKISGWTNEEFENKFDDIFIKDVVCKKIGIWNWSVLQSYFIYITLKIHKVFFQAFICLVMRKCRRRSSYSLNKPIFPRKIFPWKIFVKKDVTHFFITTLKHLHISLTC